MKMWSSFEALVVGILEVKTNYNFTARFKSYSFLKNESWHELAYQPDRNLLSPSACAQDIRLAHTRP
jgi:hypothetical protein